MNDTDDCFTQGTKRVTLGEPIRKALNTALDTLVPPTVESRRQSLLDALDLANSAERELAVTIKQSLEEVIKGWQTKWGQVLPNVTITVSPEQSYGGRPKTLVANVGVKLPTFSYKDQSSFSRINERF